MPAERKRPRSTLIFRDLNKFWRKKEKTEITCSNTNKNPNIHNPLKSTTDPYNIYSAKQEKWYISKLQTSHQWKIQFKLRNSKKPTKTEHGSQYIGGSDSVEVQSYKLDIVMVAAVSNAIGDSNVAFRKSLDSISSVVSCKLAKCENECDDEDEHAKYFCCKLND